MVRLKKLYSFNIVKTVFLVLICTIIVFQPAYATLPANLLNEYSQNNITFYDPTEDPCASGLSYTAKPTGNQITWIGDSYSTISANYGIFSEKLPGVDLGPGTSNTSTSYIQGSKWFTGNNNDNPSGVSILENIVKEGNLREYLVFALGTNGGMSNWGTTDYFQKVVDLAGSNTKIVFMTLRTLDGDNDANTKSTYNNFNTTLRNFASYNSNVYLADWDKTVGSNINQYFSSNDGIHPKDKTAFEAWFDTIYNALPGGSVGTLAGNNDVEKTWNFLANANIDGVSNNPAAIAGIIGNLLVESPDLHREWGIDPFYGNGTYYGIIQDLSGRLKSAVESAGYGGYWHTISQPSRAPEDAVSAALQIELQYLVTEYPRFVGTNGWERQGFLKNLDAPQDQNSPEAWAELFEISVEGAYATSGISSQTPNDPGVKAYNSKYFSRYSAWQGLGRRRENARKVFDTYAGTSASIIASSMISTSTGSATTTASWNNGWLESGLPGLTIEDVTNYPDLGETVKRGYTTPDNKPNKILLHSTEGTVNGYSAYPVGNKYPAHFIIDLKKKETIQNLPITNRAMSTRSSDGSAIQIEIVGYSTPSSSNSDYYLQNFTASEWDYLALLLGIISAETNIPLTTSMNWNIDYNNTNAIRSTNYVDFNNNITGIVGHMHSPDDTHIDPGNIWPMLEEAIKRNPTASQFANNSINSTCGVGTASSVVTEGGLTYEQAKELAMNYGANKGNSSLSAMGALMWSYCGGGGSNCVSFSKFFVNKFTSTNINYGLDNGWHTVDSIASNSNVPTGYEPQVWSVFQVGNNYPGHTGVVVGYENGEWIVIQASCSRGRSGKRGIGNGTDSGGGSAFVVKSADLHTAVMGYRNSRIKYAYFGDQIDKNKISTYLSTGE